jgi:hypothetical protein
VHHPGFAFMQLLDSLLRRGLLIDELPRQPQHWRGKQERGKASWMGLCRPPGAPVARRIDIKARGGTCLPASAAPASACSLLAVPCPRGLAFSARLGLPCCVEATCSRRCCTGLHTQCGTFLRLLLCKQPGGLACRWL